MKQTGSILRAIFDSTNDVWFFVAPDYSILFYNQKAYDNGRALHNRELKTGDIILDYARDTRNHVDEQFVASFQKALKGELVVDRQKIEYNDVTLWFQSKYVPVFENGELIGISIVVSDITHEKHLEQAQEEANMEIQLLLQKREDFMSIASHELKTPLTGIKSLIQILLRKSKNDHLDLYQDILKKANHQVNRISLLINDLLDITRIDAGKMSLNPTACNLRKMLEECVYMKQPENQTHNIQITGEADLVIKGDENRLEQVFCNLLSNAIKYSSDGSDITVHVKQSPEWVMITIRDQGIGIPEENLSSIFQRFYRVNDASFKSGLGLGLYIANEIIKQHGGKIEASSELGKGTIFSVYLPCTPVKFPLSDEMIAMN